MSGKVKGTRTRAPNFTKEDQILLFNAMKAFTHIIECKQTDTVKQCDKQNAWIEITEIFNSTSATLPRTTENLISCYRNVKSKIKKQHSDAKMKLVDPRQKQALLEALEDNGKDWEKVAKSSNWQDPQLCQEGFEELKKELKREDNKTKKSIMGTGGGPSQLDKTENQLTQLKKLIEPQIDGLYTMYDSDAILMSQYQDSIGEEERIRPIELQFVDNTKNVTQESQAIIIESAAIDANQTDESEIYHTPRPLIRSRTEILRKKKEVALTHHETSRKKKNINESFKQLSEAKLELVELQKRSLEMDIMPKKIIHEAELHKIAANSSSRIFLLNSRLNLIKKCVKKNYY